MWHASIVAFTGGLFMRYEVLLVNSDKQRPAVPKGNNLRWQTASHPY